MSGSAKGPPDTTDERPSDDEVDYLLSAGRLGGTQRDRIFAAVVASTDRQDARPSARSARARGWVAAAGAAVLGAAALLVVWARGTVDHERFGTKGQTGASAPSVDAECLRATLGACPRGSILAFSVRGAPAETYVTASLAPAAPATSGPRVWLLSNEPASAHAPGGSGVLARGARVPDGQAAGNYSLEVVVTKRPVPRDEAAPSRSSEELVTRTRFEITVPP